MVKKNQKIILYVKWKNYFVKKIILKKLFCKNEKNILYLINN